MPTVLQPSNTAILICDVQERMGGAIYEFDSVVSTAVKMVKIGKLLNIPVLLSEQHPKGLGPTAARLREEVNALPLNLNLGTFEKKMFGMVTPQVQQFLQQPYMKDIQNIVLLGIEAHICIVQTAIDLMDKSYNVFVLADGISSCNKEEIGIAVAQIRQAGAVVTTSESIGFRLLGSAEDPRFKEFAALIKDAKEATTKSLNNLIIY